MIKIAVCDDEIHICDLLNQKVAAKMEQWEEPFMISCFNSSEKLMLSPAVFDLLLLDIQMPGLDGVELARKIRKDNSACAFIFITALKEYVSDAFEVEAIDYLNKPVKEDKLENALKRALKRIRENREKCLFIQTMNWCKSVKINTIYYCEVINRKIYLHTQSGIINYYCKIEEIEKQLDYRFVKCHRSYLVNLDYLQEYANGQILLENGERIPVSRLRHQEFVQAMLRYMKKGDE